MGTNTSCDPRVLASMCDSLAPCLVFNSNGWLKGCASSECGSAAHFIEGVDSWVKNGGYWPPAPVPPVDDIHYPPEEPSETTIFSLELPVLIMAGQGWALLQQGALVENVSVGFFAFDSYLLLWASSDDTSGPVVVVERSFSRWAATSFLRSSAPSEVLRLRRGVGRIWNMTSSPSYESLTHGQPSYYSQAAWQPDDYLAQRFINASADGEPTFTAVAAFLPPQVTFRPLLYCMPFL